MVVFQKRSCKLLMFNFDVYFRKIEVINYFLFEKTFINCVAGYGIIHATV